MKRLIGLLLGMVMVLGAAQAQAAQYDATSSSTSPLIMTQYVDSGSSSAGAEIGIAVDEVLNVADGAFATTTFTWNQNTESVLGDLSTVSVALYGSYRKSSPTGALAGYTYLFSSTNSDLTSIRSGMYTSYGAAVDAVDGYYNTLDTDNDGIVINADASHVNSYDTRLNGNSGAAGQMYGFLGTDLSGEVSLAPLADGADYVVTYLYALDTNTPSGRDGTPTLVGTVVLYANGTGAIYEGLYDPNVVVPEPSTVLLMAGGFLGLLGLRRRVC